MESRYHGHVRTDHGIVAYENVSVIHEVGVEIDYDIFPEVYIAKTVVGGYGRDDEQFFAVGARYLFEDSRALLQTVGRIRGGVELVQPLHPCVLLFYETCIDAVV